MIERQNRTEQQDHVPFGVCIVFSDFLEPQTQGNIPYILLLQVFAKSREKLLVKGFEK